MEHVKLTPEEIEQEIARLKESLRRLELQQKIEAERGEFAKYDQAHVLLGEAIDILAWANGGSTLPTNIKHSLFELQDQRSMVNSELSHSVRAISELLEQHRREFGYDYDTGQPVETKVSR